MDMSQEIDKEKFEGMDLENFSLSCHFSNDEELTQWLQSLNVAEKKWLSKKLDSEFWNWWLSLSNEEQKREEGK
jgi:hypothetical protein